MSSPERNLPKSFEDLPKFAESMADVDSWFKTNPQSLVGDTNFPENATFDVKTTWHLDDVLMHARVNDEMGTYLDLEISYEAPTSIPLWTEQMHNGEIRIVNLKHQAYLSLSLQKWAFATAYVAETFMRYNKHTSDLDMHKELRNKLDTFLEIHFPGWTIQRLSNFTDLMPIDDTGKICEGTIQKMLFASRKPESALPNTFEIS